MSSHVRLIQRSNTVALSHLICTSAIGHMVYVDTFKAKAVSGLMFYHCKSYFYPCENKETQLSSVDLCL